MLLKVGIVGRRGYRGPQQPSLSCRAAVAHVGHSVQRWPPCRRDSCSAGLGLDAAPLVSWLGSERISHQ